ncbi:MAG: sigma-54-dependent Fis family transcriptional regulator [Deltaproteobacteria bacterium]|nr:sigma-54-dependent Fis family transcriptional regulator [Deltaproteobacteria bacterium]
MLKGKRILVADDEASMREFLEILLKREGCEATLAPDGTAALALLESDTFDLVLTDLRMPKVSGLKVLEKAKEKDADLEVVMMTAFASAETAIKAMKQGAYDYVTKPFKVDELLSTLERALEKRQLVRHNAVLRRQLSDTFVLDDIIGRSGPMQQVFDIVRRVADTPTSVLISGESGTGKELVARAIHTTGGRAHMPFIPLNCGAIPDALMESELFGHVRGAFTGAVADKLGLFRAADGGTLFLDELAELGLPLQVKLLRALQERKILPVGGEREISIDVRVVAATNRDLDAEVKNGSFRQDLFYRLNVIPLAVPPLRERREDVPLLATHFVARYAAQTGRPVTGFDPDTLARLCNYHFPGNVRELENMIERAVTLSQGTIIDSEMLPELQERPFTGDASPELPEAGLDLDRHVVEMETRLVRLALERSGGNRIKAARLLGLSQRSLRYRMAKYGVDADTEKSLN